MPSKAKPSDLGKGAARKAAEAAKKRNARNRRSGLAAAQAALGIRRKNQTTDSNNG